MNREEKGTVVWSIKNALTECEAVRILDAALSRHYVELPVDADGVPIRIGDIVKCTFADDNATVKYLSLQEDGWSIVVEYPGGRGHRTPESMRHVKQRTIEDVLTDFAEKWMDTADANALLAKYADELRNMGVGE